MNEKTIFIVCLMFLWLFTLSGCCTRAGIRDNGDRAYEVRAHIGELSERQTESAIASEQLNGTLEGAREKSENLSGELTRSREQSEHLEQSITDGAGDIESLAAILQRIRARGCRNNSGKAGNNQ
ncbi:MAG: hypothetical protein ACTTI6_09320 [Treponema sp.]|uniref:hypothetical protein n=1 Tax=Treponema sp. TaxID=166 RepID=UPI003FA1EABC